MKDKLAFLFAIASALVFGGMMCVSLANQLEEPGQAFNPRSDLPMILLGVLSLTVMITLCLAFWTLATETKPKYSPDVLLSILSVWTLGIGLVLYFFRHKVSSFGKPIIWTATAMSAIFQISLWFVVHSAFTIPVALTFIYLIMITTARVERVIVPLVINLILCGVLCSFIVSSGLWK